MVGYSRAQIQTERSRKALRVCKICINDYGVLDSLYDFDSGLKFRRHLSAAPSGGLEAWAQGSADTLGCKWIYFLLSNSLSSWPSLEVAPPGSPRTTSRVISHLIGVLEEYDSTHRILGWAWNWVSQGFLDSFGVFISLSWLLADSWDQNVRQIQWAKSKRRNDDNFYHPQGFPQIQWYFSGVRRKNMVSFILGAKQGERERESSYDCFCCVSASKNGGFQYDWMVRIRQSEVRPNFAARDFLARLQKTLKNPEGRAQKAVYFLGEIRRQSSHGFHILITERL